MPCNYYLDSRVGQNRSIRCNLLSNKRTRGVNDTTNLPKVCLRFSPCSSRHCWESTNTKQSCFLVQPCRFRLLAPHRKGSKRALHCTVLVLPLACCTAPSTTHSVSQQQLLCTAPRSAPLLLPLWRVRVPAPAHLNSSNPRPNLGPASCTLLASPLCSFKPEATVKP